MLKPHGCVPARLLSDAATFGWLCVETMKDLQEAIGLQAATFGWLCVETPVRVTIPKLFRAATFGWLCVETVPSV